MYHGVCDNHFTLLKGFDERHISKSTFRKQLDYLKRRGYKFAHITELVDAIKSKGKISKFVVLTFDDGFSNVIKNAYPIIREFNAKGCFYLVSDLVGTNHLLWTDYVETVIRNQKKGNFKFLFNGEEINYILTDKQSYENTMLDIKNKLRSIPDHERYEHLEQFNKTRLGNIPKEFIMADWDQIKGIDPRVLEIGSHTRRHPDCANIISDEELIDEIYNSKTIIERKSNHKIQHFCYPNGSYNDRVIAEVIKSNYESGVTIENGYTNNNSDLYKLRRIEATQEFLLFKAKISGSYNIIRKMATLLKRPSAVSN